MARPRMPKATAVWLVENTTLTFDQISVGRPFNKYSPADRIRWEREYGRATIERLAEQSGVAIMCNVPLLAMASFVRAARRTDRPWVFWHQDVYSVAMLAEQLFPGQGQPLSVLWRDKQIEYTRLVTTSDDGAQTCVPDAEEQDGPEGCLSIPGLGASSIGPVDVRFSGWDNTLEPWPDEPARQQAQADSRA